MKDIDKIVNATEFTAWAVSYLVSCQELVVPTYTQSVGKWVENMKQFAEFNPPVDPDEVKE